MVVKDLFYYDSQKLHPNSPAALSAPKILKKHQVLLLALRPDSLSDS